MVMRNSDVGRTSDGARTGAGGSRGAPSSLVIPRYPSLFAVIRRYHSLSLVIGRYPPLSPPHGRGGGSQTFPAVERELCGSVARRKAFGEAPRPAEGPLSAVISRYLPLSAVIQDNAGLQVKYGVS